MDFLDCRGKTCPEPVIQTKRIIEEGRPDELQVAVDNETSRENVRRFLESRGYRVEIERRDEGTFLLGRRSEEEKDLQGSEQKRAVVYINAETMGRGDDVLGAILMKSFFFALKELKPLPWKIIFINSGVKLPSEGSDCLSALHELESLGVEIMSCGTCLDFFHLKEKLRAGRVSNMFEIVSSLADAAQVLKP
jgi:selenium metabolism protein YedF